MATNKEVLFVTRPEGVATADSFKLVDKAMPELTKDGEILIKVLYLSVDPYMRPKMEEQAYATPYAVDKAFSGMGIGQVVESKNKDFSPKQIIKGFLRWNNYDKYTIPEIQLFLIHVLVPVLDLSDHLHIACVTGASAHVGLLEFGKPKAGDVVLVSSAAGACGTLVGAIAKLKGASKVIGIVGSDDKAALIKKEFKYDATINYKTEDVKTRIAELAPKGVNVYFDNVGGPMLDAVLVNMASNGRIVCCGSISGYNLGNKAQPALHNYNLIVPKRLSIQGFVVSDHSFLMFKAQKELAQWVQEGRVQSKKTITKGLENSVAAFNSLFEGGNIGKALVHVADPSS